MTGRSSQNAPQADSAIAEPDPCIAEPDLCWVEQGRPPDFYLDLGVPRTATAAQIRESYRALALRFHPDAAADCPPRLAEARIRQVNAAYAVLGSPGRRSDYDRSSR